MYHCHVQFYLIGHQRQRLEQLKKLTPAEHFTHTFLESNDAKATMAAGSDVIFADLQGMAAKDVVQALVTWKKNETELIVLADKAQLPELADSMPEIADIWTLPMSDTELQFHLLRWQKAYKMRVEYWQTSHYLEATINNIPTLIWYKDKNGIHEKVNDSFCQTVGKTKQQVEGQGHAYIWDVEQDDPACIESERKVMESKKTFVSEEIIQTGEGRRTLTTYKSPLFDWDGSVMGTVGVAIDITREQAYAQELIKKNQTLETLFTTMECGVMSHSLDGSHIISINRAALKILGYESQEALMEDGFHMIAASVVDEDKEKVRRSISQLQHPGDNVSVNYRVQHKDGNFLYVMGNVKLVEENGERFYQRYLLDCTAQKLREEHERREEEQRQMELIHALSVEYVLVCYFDLDSGKGYVLRMNGQQIDIVQTIFTGDLVLETCMAQYAEERVYSEDKEEFLWATSREQLKEELSEKDLYSTNYRVMYDGEIRYFQMKVARTGDWNESRGVVLGFCSVDEEMREEIEKKAVLKDALLQANKANKAKTAFLSNMSHDIRTPMNAIIGFTKLAIDRIDEKEQTAEYLKKIEASGNHLLNLINDVLDMSHIESGKMHLDEQPCNLSHILQELYNIIQGDAQAKQLELVVDAYNIQHEEIYCDRLRLNQVLLNLLSNAVKYTNAGGVIGLSLTETSNEANEFATYEFRVRDTGIGMSEEFVARIFEPFERERTSTVSGVKGTGLGMAIAKNIVDMMNGTIEVRSQQGVGAECIVSFTFRLNTTADTAGMFNPVPNQKRHTEIALPTGRILLVEDNDLNREIAVDILEGAGLSVDIAENGQVALNMLQHSVPGWYELILMDIQMPVMNGYEATKAICKLEDEALAKIPILALTANAFEEDRQNALRSGMDGHIAKPINIDTLMEKLNEIFAKKNRN